MGRESYVAADKTFCVYLAKDEAIIHEHARRSGFPADKVTEVRRMIDPTTASESSNQPRWNPPARDETRKSIATPSRNTAFVSSASRRSAAPRLTTPAYGDATLDRRLGDGLEDVTRDRARRPEHDPAGAEAEPADPARQAVAPPRSSGLHLRTVHRFRLGW